MFAVDRELELIRDVKLKECSKLQQMHRSLPYPNAERAIYHVDDRVC